MKTVFNSRNLLLLTIIFISGLLLSPKWFLAAAVWIYYPSLLHFARTNHWRGWLLGYLAVWGSSVAAQYEVFPMPLTTMAIFMLVACAVGLLPLLIDRLVHHRFGFLAESLVFPVVATLLDVFLANGPQGTWGNAIYTQFHFTPLMQLASVMGIFGISFLYYWFAATMVGYLKNGGHWRQLLPYVVTFSAAILYGGLSLMSPAPEGEHVRVAAVVLDNGNITSQMYASEFGRQLRLPANGSQSDPIVAEIQKGLFAFMADSESPRFASVYEAIDSVQHAYFEQSKIAAQEGVKIIAWPEAAIITVKSREEKLMAEAAAFAKAHKVYLFYPMAVFHPEKVAMEKLFIENKVMTYGPNGVLLNTYFKNVPVMGVEPSFPGDGIIPIIETPYGKLSPTICYDLDHPKLVAQVSTTATELLVVPTGDWAAIAPYHTYMAAIRCIENGTNMLKATSRGTSALVDTKGQIIASAELGKPGEHLLIGEMELGSTNTSYPTTGR